MLYTGREAGIWGVKPKVAYLTKKERLQPIKPGLKENIFYRGDVEKNV